MPLARYANAPIIQISNTYHPISGRAEFGIDLYFPNVGTESGNSQNTTNTIDRFESIKSVPGASVGRFNQVIVTNGTEVAIGRTIRGFNYISADRHTGPIAILQAATE
jgi:hypothetical protein